MKSLGGVKYRAAYAAKKRKIEREKREKREKKREKDIKGQLLLLICIQFSKRKTKYIGRNSRNL